MFPYFYPQPLPWWYNYYYFYYFNRPAGYRFDIPWENQDIKGTEKITSPVYKHIEYIGHCPHASRTDILTE